MQGDGESGDDSRRLTKILFSAKIDDGVNLIVRRKQAMAQATRRQEIDRFEESARHFPRLRRGHGGSIHNNNRCVVPGCNRGPDSKHFQMPEEAALDWLESRVGR